MNNFENSNILVAGAAGFVPSYLCEYYLKKGARVWGLDNFITGSKSNIELLKKYPNFHFFACNIYQSLPDFGTTKFDYIYSLASPASPIDFDKIPLEIMMVNSEGTRMLLELARKHAARFLEASTSEVYGDPEIHPQVESYFGNVNPIGPRSCYDESKRFAEALTMTYHRHFGVDTRIVRIFNTYGPRMRANDGRVVPNFITQAMNNQDITVYGDGLQTRSYCYVEDLVEAMHQVMMSSDSTPFNIGNPDEYTILETAEMVIKTLGSKSRIIHLPLPKDDPKKRRPNISKLQQLNGFVPKMGFAEGIERTAQFFKSLS
jgi:dTDP-glucose 4,6-dehydratase